MRFCADVSGGVSRARFQARREGVALSGYATALRQARGLAAGATPPHTAATPPPLSPMLATPHEDARHSGAAPVRRHDAQQRADSPHAGTPYERPTAASPRGGDGGKREVVVSVDATRNTTTAQGGTYAITDALKAAGFRYEKTPAPHWALGYAADGTVLRVLRQAADAERVPLRVVALSGGGGGGNSGASGQQHAW
jgi:hypothetical protein